jgi:hypothetical protein
MNAERHTNLAEEIHEQYLTRRERRPWTDDVNLNRVLNELRGPGIAEAHEVNSALRAAERLETVEYPAAAEEEEEDGNPLRGLTIALLISMLVWAALIAIFCCCCCCCRCCR